MNFCMVRFVKQIVWLAVIAVLVLGRQSARAFSLGGPIGNGPDSYQTLTLGYNIPALDLTAPKAVQQWYRHVTPIMYYAPSANFLNFFGIEGVKALDQAFALFNGVTNVDLYTPNLVEFPDSAQRINQRAASLSLTDLKSFTLGLMTEQLGLFQPVRAVWDLRFRFLPPGASCPTGEEYLIINRNLDIQPLSSTGVFQYSSYVNDTLYSYFIFEDCGRGSPPNPVADAEEFAVDPEAQTYTAVADYASLWYDGLAFSAGGYYTGLTRDDVAGLRYLIGTNNTAIESAGVDTIQFETNAQSGAIITTQDLNLFTAQALTNGPAALTALYPGLIITSVSNSFILTRTTNINETLVNVPLDPAGAPPSHPRFSTNFVTAVTPIFQYTFGNLITNQFSTRGLVGTITLGLTNSPLSPAGTPATAVVNTKVTFVNGTFGNFYLLPAGLCGVDIVANLLTNVVITTNFPTTNALVTTGASNIVAFTAGSITFATNVTFEYLPVTCPVDTVARRQGVRQMTFLRRDFDSLLNQFWSPVTNDYTVYALTNGFYVPQHIRRVVTVPDFLFDAQDIGVVTGQGVSPASFNRNVPFDQANVPAGAAGPGTIGTTGPAQITFNTISPSYLLTGGGSQGAGQSPELIWGSFDGTTNDPVVYPSSMSIAELESAVLGPFIVNTSLPNGSIGNAYSVTLNGTGGQPPYTWSLTPGSAWPNGITNSVNGQVGGNPTGPAATYDLSIRITDSVTNFNDVPFTLTIQ